MLSNCCESPVKINYTDEEVQDLDAVGMEYIALFICKECGKECWVKSTKDIVGESTSAG